jgi:hypothetical protein
MQLFPEPRGKDMHIRRLAVAAAALLALALVALLALAVSAGSDGGHHKEAVNTHPIRVLRNDLKGGNLTTKHQLAGDPAVIKTIYSTDYDTLAWKITDSKTLHFEIFPVNVPPGTQMLLEHVHADVGLSATRQALNGMPQDSMEAALHAGTQDGIEITPDHPYRNDFSIEGYSQTLTSGWGFMVGGYGSPRATCATRAPTGTKSSSSMSCSSRTRAKSSGTRTSSRTSSS